MKNFVRYGLIAAVAALFVSPLCVSAGEKDEKKDDEGNEVKVAIKDLPDFVVTAVKGAQPGGTMVEADKETKKDGSIVYEVDVTNNGKNWEVIVDASGKVISNKEDLEAATEKKDEKK